MDDVIRILIADDHEVVRRGLALVLGLVEEFEIVGEAQNGAEALAEAERLAPDIVLLDMKMPVMDGRETSWRLKQSMPDVRVIVLSGAEIDRDVFDTLDAGVDGYVLKDVSPDELTRAIRMVASGQTFIHADVTRALLDQTREPRQNQPDAHLTPREMEVLHLLATSATYKEIGGMLAISEETVRSHAKGILSKLRQPNRTMAVVAALKMGLMELN